MTGVIYGYELSSCEGEGVYYFGRTKSAAVWFLDVAAEGADEREEVNRLQCKFLKKYCKKSGLNAAGNVVLWTRRIMLNGTGGRSFGSCTTTPCVTPESEILLS